MHLTLLGCQNHVLTCLTASVGLRGKALTVGDLLKKVFGSFFKRNKGFFLVSNYEFTVHFWMNLYSLKGGVKRKLLSEFEQKQLDEKLTLARAERYACQSVARKALPNERVSKCLRAVNRSEVDVWKHKKTQKAFYGGLLVCGSVWHCPICAAKISERRRKELKQAFDIHKSEGGHIALLTLTFSHKKTDKLKDTLKKFGQATQKFMSGRAYQNIRDELGLVGRIRVFEVTYGANGFHPHCHIALFYTSNVDLKKIKEKMTALDRKSVV